MPQLFIWLNALISPLVDLELIKEEFEDYQLMEDTEVGMEEGGVQKYVDRYWGEITKLKTALGQMRFPALAQIMIAVLRLPYSNADCDRDFLWL